MTTTGYTTLEHLKRSLNNGELPMMTPVAEKAKRLIDPAFVLGQGGLQEDEKRGLRCPVRGCGGYYHHLGLHWAAKHHKTVGPTQVLREALGLHPKRSLISSAYRATRSGVMQRRRGPRTTADEWRMRREQIGEAELQRRSSESRRAATTSMEVRNLRGRCDEQMRTEYLALRDKLGHDPSAPELTGGFMAAVRRHYGTLNALRATIGVAPVAVGSRRGSSEEDVIDALEVWFHAHGKLPSYGDAAALDRTPYLPTSKYILKVLGISSWPVAMSHVAWLLGIDDPNYSPKKREAA